MDQTTPTRPHEPARSSLPPVAVAVSRYNASVTDRLLKGAIDEYASRGGDPALVTVLHAPGAFELPAIALAAAQSGRFAGVVALGCLVRGETRHDRYIAQAVAHGLIDVTMRTGVPAAFGVITADTPEQAKARAGGKKGNKGTEAMAAVLDAAAVIAAVAQPAEASGSSATHISRSLLDKVAGKVGGN